MARVKSFRINPKYGVPDKDIAAFLDLCEKDGIISVTTAYIPGYAEGEVTMDAKLTVIVTKLDDSFESITSSPEPRITVRR